MEDEDKDSEEENGFAEPSSESAAAEENVCPVCGSANIVFDRERGEITCSNCGIVIDVYMDHGLDTGIRIDERGRKIGFGSPETFTRVDKGQATVIRGVKDARGKQITANQIERMRRIRRASRESRSSSIDRNMKIALREFKNLATKLNLPMALRESAVIYYNKLVKAKLTWGRRIEEVVAAAIFIACRLAGIPHDIEEISQYAEVKEKAVGRAVRLALNSLSIRLPPPLARNYVPKYVSDLNLPYEVASEAIEILEEAEIKGLATGRDPSCLAGAAIYIACGRSNNPRTQVDVAKAVHCSELTIRNRSKEIAKFLGVKTKTK
ncbi:MAG: TFIIB-type zinc ribbon-containing protein [Promethearchaeati archaeon SRVP18_Atabeyarchaeia-1]